MTARTLPCLLLLGCFAPPSDARPLHISPDFAPAEQQSVLAAADQWNAAVDAQLTPTIGPCVPGEICIAPTHAPIAGDANGTSVTSLGVSVGKTSYLYVDHIAFLGVPLRKTALHELGHAMELLHHAAGTAMAAVEQEQAADVTADDVAQWKAVQR